jgi:hypothetical protein
MFNPFTVTQVQDTIRWAQRAGKLALVNVSLALLQLLMGWVNQSNYLWVNILTFLISSLISGYIAYHVLQYASKMKIALAQHDIIALKTALNHLKYYFGLMGLLLVIVSIMALLALLLELLTIIVYQ